MIDEQAVSVGEGVGISLVDGDPSVRHARQIMLLSQKYDVRSYATCGALLDDPRSRDFPCIILDVASKDVDGVALLSRMRATGWRGKAILLDGADPGGALRADVERHGDRVLERGIGDHRLLTAIEASVDRSWSGWNARC
jgi:FixJ family two-component response regulator